MECTSQVFPLPFCSSLSRSLSLLLLDWENAAANEGVTDVRSVCVNEAADDFSTSSHFNYNNFFAQELAARTRQYNIVDINRKELT